MGIDSKSIREDPLGLSFGSHQDALDYASRVVEEESKRSLARLRGQDILELYRDSKIDIVLKLHVSNLGERDLVIGAVVPQIFNPAVGVVGIANVNAIEACCTFPGQHRNERAMLIVTGPIADGVEQVIPSRVRLEAAKERTNILWDFLAPIGPGHCVFGSSAEGEVCQSVIKSRPKVGGSISDNSGEIIWNEGLESNLMDSVGRNVRIRLDRFLVWVNVLKNSDALFEFLDVVPAARELAP